MAKDEVVSCAAGVMTELTDSDVTAITIAHISGPVVELFAATAASPAPDGSGSRVLLRPGETVLNKSMADLFPGVTGADRVFARPKFGNGTSRLSVSHA